MIQKNQLILGWRRLTKNERILKKRGGISKRINPTYNQKKHSKSVNI